MTLFFRSLGIVATCLLLSSAAHATTLVSAPARPSAHAPDSLDRRATRLVRLMAADLVLTPQQEQIMLYYLCIQLHELRDNVLAGAISPDKMASEGRKQMNDLVANILSAKQLEILPQLLEKPAVCMCLRGLQLQI